MMMMADETARFRRSVSGSHALTRTQANNLWSLRALFLYLVASPPR
jgi:hypothetical protein